MEKEVGDLLCPAGSQSFLLPPQIGVHFECCGKPHNFTDPKRGSGVGGRTSRRGGKDLTHWPTWLCPLLQAAGASDPSWQGQPSHPCLRLRAPSETGPPAELWGWEPRVFSWPGLVVGEKSEGSRLTLCAGCLPPGMGPNTQTLELSPEIREVVVCQRAPGCHPWTLPMPHCQPRASSLEAPCSPDLLLPTCFPGVLSAGCRPVVLPALDRQTDGPMSEPLLTPPRP